MINEKDQPFLVGDKIFCKNSQPTFFTWCQRKGFDIKEVEKFKPEEKLKLIMRWKWFTNDDNNAKECESSRQDVLYQFKQMPPQDEGTKHWLKNALYVESEMNKIKAHFGLISQQEYEDIKNAI